jgi:hypothetical protein
MLLLLLLAPALAQQDCTAFQEGSCPLTESNILSIINDVDTPNACQVRLAVPHGAPYLLLQIMCKYEPTGACNFFTWTWHGTQCYLLKRCHLMSSLHLTLAQL